MPSSFAHLHVHTEYSMLDGAARIEPLIAAAVQDGQPAIGITDHGNMYGVLDFYKEARKQGIKPVIGSELYMAHDSRFDRPKRRGSRVDDSGGEAEGGQRLYYHLTAVAETDVGYRNLIQLSSRAFMEGYYYKPRIDWELLEEHSEGIIATTGCLSGHVLRSILDGDMDGAIAKAGRLQDIFGRDNLFVEIQNHGIDDQIRTNPALIDIARKIGAPLIATNDSHYVHRHDAVAHDALLCVQTGSQLADPNRFKFEGDEHYLKTAAEMRGVWNELPEACDSTLWIAERANVDIEFGNVELPEFPLPPEFDTDTAYLRHLTYEGARRRWGSTIAPDIAKRLDYELSVIDQMGFSAYFLITWDLIRHARENDIRVGPGRGSAAGCAVAYTLWITDLDPIKYDLLFERFLNPSRVSMPDIDMDFDSRYRDEMIRYTAEVYGRENTAQIITFSTIKARAAVRDAARVLGKDYAVGDRLAKAMPPLVMGRDTPLWVCTAKKAPENWKENWKAAGPLRKMAAEDEDAAEVLDVAAGLEGLRRSDGIHAAAVVITRHPLTDYLPIQRKPEAGQDIEDAPVVTQYEMHGVEELGLLKMDFLGLRNLDVMDMAVKMIEANRGETVDLDNLPLDDGPTFDLLRRADTIGVFQLEGEQMRALMRSLAPTSFEDVAALVALYRPGPMGANMHNDFADRKNGRKPVEYLHPDAEEILADTYGLMIYQELMMRVAQKFAGYSLAEADTLRKAAGKKVREIMAAEREKFVAGCDATGYGRELGEKWFDIIEPFADYAFNQSHAFGYGLISYQTAYLKANYPAEYLASLLTSVKDKQEKAAVYLAECRRSGVPVSVPDVNRSVGDFTVDPDVGERGGIVFGMAGIRGVGDGVAARIVATREAGGPFEDFHDFCERSDPEALNKRAVEALIKAGAFDRLGHPRQGLVLISDLSVDRAIAKRRDDEAGVMSLFGGDSGADTGFDDRPEIPDMEFDRSLKLTFEKEMLGLFVSDHPLQDIADSVRRRATHDVASLIELSPDRDRMIRVGGIISGFSTKTTKKGALMATFILEDLTGAVEVTCFPKSLERYRDVLADDAIVIVTGNLDDSGRDDDNPKLLVMTIDVFEMTAEDREIAEPVRLAINQPMLSGEAVARLRELIRQHPGERRVIIEVPGESAIRLPDDYMVSASPEFLGAVRVLFGPPAVSAA